MKIVVACDKFKGSLTADEAGRIVRDALLTGHPDWQVINKPLADGGDGTAAVLHSACGGEWRSAPVCGPLPATQLAARYLWLERDRLAIIETAAASGLALLRPEQRDPLRTTTYGTGQLLADAIRHGARRILLGLGGSATNDGGVGLAQALGWQFGDVAGNPIGFGGGELERLHTLTPPPDWNPPPIEVLCDVTNQLCGEHGAAAVFGPQKGASPAVVQRLDAGLRHLGELIRVQLGCEIEHVPGAGAAGGLGGGALAFLNARLVPGIETVVRLTGLEEAMRDADWVITGEGRFDAQSLHGKVVSGVTTLARRHRVPVAILAGSVALPEAEWRTAGIETVVALREPGMSLETALAQSATLLASAVRRLPLVARAQIS